MKQTTTLRQSDRPDINSKMNKSKTPEQKSAKGCLTAENYRTFEVNDQLVKVDDFIYRRLFRDPDIKPRRKYTFINGFRLTSGYLRIVLKSGTKQITLSRYIMHACKGEMVDHINRNKSDNRRCNLRIVNSRQNNLNRKLKNNTGLIGISGFKDKGLLFVRASYRTKEDKLLAFRCPDTPFNRILAALAHDKFVLQEGEEQYAPLNFPHWKYEPYRSFLLNEDLEKYKERSKSHE